LSREKKAPDGCMEENMIFRGIFQNEIDKKIQKYLVKKYKFNLTIK